MAADVLLAQQRACMADGGRLVNRVKWICGWVKSSHQVINRRQQLTTTSARSRDDFL
jgi:hypothetical protein